MRVQIITLIVLISSTTVTAQLDVRAIDSLKTSLTKAQHDSVRSMILADLAVQHFYIPDSNFAYATKGLALAKNVHYDKGIAANLYCLAVYHTDHLTSLNYLNQALAIEKKFGNKRQLARIYMLIGAILGEKGDWKGALENVKRSNKLFRDIEDKNGIIRTYNNIGYEFLKLKQYDSSEFFLKRALSLNPRDKNAYALLSSLAELYLEKGDFVNASAYLIKAIHANDGRDLDTQSNNYLSLSIIYRYQGRHAEALSAAEMSLNMAEQAQSLTAKDEGLQMLSALWQTSGNYEKAFIYLKQSMETRDSIFSMERRGQEARLMSELREHEKEAEIKILQQESQLREARLNFQQEEIAMKNYLLGAAILMMIMLILIALILRRQNLHRKNYIKVIEIKNLEIGKQSAELKMLVEELSELNFTLEQRAQEKAMTIIDQESKLNEYAFLNSHKLRGPVATMSGIMNLIKSGSLTVDEKEFLTEALSQEVRKIDEVISEINKAIE